MKDFGTITNTSGVYPAVVPVDGPTNATATPLVKQWVNEFWGFAQALLFNSHKTAPSGAEETYNASDLYNAGVALFRTGAGVQRGLTLSNDPGDPTNDIGIAAGVALAVASPYRVMTAVSPWTKKLDAVWAQGTAAGGRASATNLVGAKTFHVFMLAKPPAAATAHSVDFGFDTSLTATNLLADATGFTDYVRVGSILWDGAAIVPFIQYGDEFVLKTPVESLAFTTLPLAATAVALNVPTGLALEAKFTLAMYGGGSGAGTGYGVISNSDLGDIAPSATVHDVYVKVSAAANNSSVTEYTRHTNTSGQITTRFDSVANNVNYSISTRGWIDRRGR